MRLRVVENETESLRTRLRVSENETESLRDLTLRNDSPSTGSSSVTELQCSLGVQWTLCAWHRWPSRVVRSCGWHHLRGHSHSSPIVLRQVSVIMVGQGMWTCIYWCRSYRSVGDASFMESFESVTLAYEDWSHEVRERERVSYTLSHRLTWGWHGTTSMNTDLKTQSLS